MDIDFCLSFYQYFIFNIHASGASWKWLLIKVFPSYLNCPHVKYFVKQFPEVTLCLVIKIYILQKINILPVSFYKQKPIKIHRVITMYFTVWKPCILKNAKNLGKRNTTLYSRVCCLEVLIKYIWININESYSALKWCFSVFRI